MHARVVVKIEPGQGQIPRISHHYTAIFMHCTVRVSHLGVRVELGLRRTFDPGLRRLFDPGLRRLFDPPTLGVLGEVSLGPSV